MGDTGYGLGVAVGDYDNDGDTDVFIGNDVAENFLFANEGSGKFEEVGLMTGLAYDLHGDEQGSMGVDCGDYDNDGDRDIFVACGHLQDNVERFDDTTSYLTRNILLMNTGDAKFVNVSDRSGDGMDVKLSSRGERMLEMIDQAVAGYEPFFDVRLVVFPEFAHAAPIYPTIAELLDSLAVPIPNEHTQRYQEKAKELNIYIQTGTFLESDARWPGHVFNTTCLIGPEGICSKYRKVHPCIPWEVHTSPHDLAGYDEPIFPVADTEIGKIGTAICYDWLFPEAIRQLSLGGAELLIRVSAYMDPWGTAQPLDWWTTVNRVRALENMAYVVAVNQAASLQNYPPFSWPGGSMIVDYDGRILAQAEPGTGEKIVVGPIDLAALHAKRQRRRGHHILAHLRTEAYPAYRQPIYPTGRGSDGTITIESNEASIRQGRAALKRISRPLS